MTISTILATEDGHELFDLWKTEVNSPCLTCFYQPNRNGNNRTGRNQNCQPNPVLFFAPRYHDQFSSYCKTLQKEMKISRL